jgi:hypothetical protein
MRRTGWRRVAVPAPLRRWLLEGSDPSVRRRVLTELLGRPATDPEVRRARAEIGQKGWVARILAEQDPSGAWMVRGTRDVDLYVPKYIVSNWKLLVLAELGAPARHPKVARALRLFRARMGGPRGGFGGSTSEVCFTGNAARMFARFGRWDWPELGASLDWLVRAQKRDGGWHCFRSSRGTLDGWEALAAFSELPEERRTTRIRRAIERGAEFYLSRRLLREGRRPYAPWSRLHFPSHYYYDVLVGLDVLGRLGYGADRRLGEPLDLLESKRDRAGRWSIDADHPDTEGSGYDPPRPVYPFVLESAGRPSRWVTTTALLALRRAGRA